MFLLGVTSVLLDLGVHRDRRLKKGTSLSLETALHTYSYSYRLVQVKRRKIIPRPKSPPFLESDREFLHTSSMSPEDLA